MTNQKGPAYRQAGFAHLLILLAALGIIAFLLVSSLAPFKDKLFSFLYPKPSSHAQSTDSLPFSYIAPKAARPQILRQEYPYTVPQKLTDGIYASDNPIDHDWVKFSRSNVNPYFFGVNGFKLNWSQLASMASEMGVQTIRLNTQWNEIETSKRVFDWSKLDAMLEQSASYGVKPYFLVLFTPQWAQNPYIGRTAPPNDLQDYANFVAALVNHVNSTFPNKTAKVVEVWNEINETTFWTGNDQQYLNMLKLTYNSVKAADPSWRVMAETFSGMQIPEFNYMYAFTDTNGDSLLKKYSDLLAIHPYSKTSSPDDSMNPAMGWNNFSLLADNTQRIKDNKLPGSSWGWCCFEIIAESDPSPSILRNWRQVMIKNGDGNKKVWLTEMGWHRTMFDGSNSQWPYSPDANRVAELITRLIEKSSEYDFVENVTVFDLYANRTANLVDVYNGYTKTNAYYAFQNLATTDGIFLDLSKSPTNAYPTPQFNIKRVDISTLNNASSRIQKIDVSTSSDNITYNNVGQITNSGPETGRVSLALDNINQIGRWIKLQITLKHGTSSYLIDEITVNGPTPIPTPTPTPTPTSSPLDTTPPSVSITSPLNNAKIQHGSTVLISASATDNIAVTKVEFFINNSLKCTSTVAPYTCTWKVPGKKGVQYNIKATAFDRSANQSSSAIIILAQ